MVDTSKPISFGKHAGTPWVELPVGYLRWIDETLSSKPVRKMARAALRDKDPKAREAREKKLAAQEKKRAEKIAAGPGFGLRFCDIADKSLPPDIVIGPPDEEAPF